MTRKSKKICKFCVKLIPDNNYKTLEEDSKQILDVLLLQVDMKCADQCVICIDCLGTMQKCLEFKSCCLDVEDYISPYIKNGANVDIGRVLQKQVKIVDKDMKLCRLCIDVVQDDNCTHLDQDESRGLVDDIRNCLPELNIYAIHDPLICEKCINRLKAFSSFQKKCRFSNNFSESNKLAVCSNSKDDSIKLKANVDTSVKDDYNLEDNGDETKSCLDQIDIKIEEVDDANNVASIEYVKYEDSDIKNEPFEVTSVSSATQEGMRACTYPNDGQNTPDCKAEILIRNDSAEIEMYKCTTCNYKNRFEQRVKWHMKTHLDPSEKKMYKCDVCDYTTPFKQYLKKHNLVHKDSSETVTYHCNYCEFKSKWRNNLPNHVLTHKNLSQVKIHKCPTCNFSTKYKRNLKYHMITHVDPAEKTYKCDTCDYTTHSELRFKSHKFSHKVTRRTDTYGNQRYKCTVCDFETEKKRDLNQHRLIHSDSSDMHKCGVCDYTTHYIWHLKKHSLVHKKLSEADLYKCNECGFKSKWKWSLVNHLLTHKNPSQVKMHKCATCNFTTKYKNSLKSHELIHLDPAEKKMYQCDQCDYTIHCKYNMKRHRLSHKNKKKDKVGSKHTYYMRKRLVWKPSSKNYTENKE